MAERPVDQEPSWRTDPTVRFDRIHIIESLPEKRLSFRTGRLLFERLETLCLGTAANPALHVIGSRAELLRLLDRVVAESKDGRYPLLHFETHGADRAPGISSSSVGLVLESYELVTWKELAPYLCAINEATQLRLLVFAAACYGLDAASLIQPLTAAPFRVLVGPIGRASVHEVDVATTRFYSELFRSNDGAAAARALSSAVSGFWTLTAESLFLQIMLGYYNEKTNESQLAARVEGIVAEWLVRGMPPAELPRARAAVRAHIEDRRRLFDWTYRRFFMVDKYPEIADRFALSFDLCFREAPASGVGL